MPLGALRSMPEQSACSCWTEPLQWGVWRLYINIRRFRKGAPISLCHHMVAFPAGHWHGSLGVSFLYFLHCVSCVSLVSLTPGLETPKCDTFSVQGTTLVRSKSRLSQLLWSYEAVWLGSQTGSLHDTKISRCKLQNCTQKKAQVVYELWILDVLNVYTNS